MYSAPNNLLQKLVARCSSWATRSLLILLLCSASVYADLPVNVYTGTTAQSPIKNGCVFVNFSLSGFTGTIGNASFSNITIASFPIESGYQGGTGQRLSAIPYTVSSGTLIICEVR